jgi:hypothetical protein
MQELAHPTRALNGPGILAAIPESGGLDRLMCDGTSGWQPGVGTQPADFAVGSRQMSGV